MVTMIVGRKNGTEECSITTLCPGADEPHHIRFKSEHLQPGNPKWVDWKISHVGKSFSNELLKARLKQLMSKWLHRTNDSQYSIKLLKENPMRSEFGDSPGERHIEVISSREEPRGEEEKFSNLCKYPSSVIKRSRRRGKKKNQIITKHRKKANLRLKARVIYRRWMINAALPRISLSLW